MVAPMYDPLFIAERWEILNETRRIVSSGELPVVQGMTYDRPGTKVAEQGMSVHTEGDETLVGYHIVDIGAFPVGGEVEFQGYIAKRQRCATSQRPAPMFGDRRIPDTLNLLANPTPVLSFYFEPTPGEPTLVRTERSVFEIGARVDPVRKAVAHYKTPPGARDPSPLANGERALQRATNRHVQAVIEEAGWQALPDKNNSVSITGPLRRWTFYKNQQLYGQLMAGGTPVYTQEQFDAMKGYILSQRARAEREDITPSTAGQTIVDLLESEDVRRHMIGDDTYTELLDSLEAQASREDAMLANILNWAVRTGLAHRDGRELQLHNLDSAVRLTTDGELTPDAALDALLKVLAYRPRNEGEAERVASAQQRQRRRTGEFELRRIRAQVGASLYGPTVGAASYFS